MVPLEPPLDVVPLELPVVVPDEPPLEVVPLDPPLDVVPDEPPLDVVPLEPPTRAPAWPAAGVARMLPASRRAPKISAAMPEVLR